MYILRSILLILFFIIALTSESFAEGKAQIGKRQTYFKVDQIRIEGVQKVEPEAILEKIAIRQGMNVDNYLIRSDIERIYQMKHFETVEFHHENEKGKDVLVIKVSEKPIIKKIDFKGNSELDLDELKEQIKTKEFSILDINTIQNDVISLQKFYEEKGFFLANIDYQIVRKPNQVAEVHFIIKEFDKVKVKRITFLGNERFSDDELRGIMFTREENLLSFMSGSGNFKEFDFKTDIERIKFFYKTKGHLQVIVGSPDVTASDDKKWIFITVNIVEGPVFTINDITFNGEVLFDEAELLDKLSLKKGSEYAEDLLREDIRVLTELYQDKGYAFANVLRNIRIVPGETKINLDFSFEKGNIAYFGKIKVKGNTKTRDKVIRRELKVHEGMKYSGSLLRKSKENVNRLGFFEQNSVIFNTVPSDEDPNILDVEIQIKERNTGQLSLGAGYSTASGGFFQGSVAQNNFRGLGQNLKLSFQQSKNTQSFSFSFTEPYFLDTKWSSGFDIFRQKNELGEDQIVENKGFDFRLGYPIYEYTRVFGTYKLIDTSVSKVNDSTLDINVENGVASIVEAALIRDTRNNRFEPSKGSYLSVSTEYAGVGFDKKWVKSEVDLRYYQSIIGELVMRTRFLGGRLFVVDGNPIPRNTKFFLGGPRNMRGYGSRDISPKQEGQDTSTSPPATRVYSVGGLSSLYSTLEFEHPLVKEAGMKWVVFMDAGNVYQEAFTQTPGDDFLRYDYGFGIRWFSPIGVLRFEFGYPINQKEGEDSSQFFFDIGQLF